MATLHNLTAFRCIWEKRPDKLISTRKEGRWNKEGANIVYAADSRALAAFELLVHLDADRMLSKYKFLKLTFPEDSVKFVEMPNADFLKQTKRCQEYGHSWYLEKSHAIMRIPSVIIPSEYNYAINLDHPDSQKAKVAGIELFYQFDKRLKN